MPLRLLLDAQLGVGAPALPFFFAIVASAWIGGFAPGVLATLLSVVAVQMFRRRSQEAGFDCHLVKPVDAKALSEALLQVG